MGFGRFEEGSEIGDGFVSLESWSPEFGKGESSLKYPKGLEQNPISHSKMLYGSVSESR